jgi:hypothetical protein
MSQPSPQTGYLFDRGRRGDQDRLIRSSEVLGEFVTEACFRAGLASGGGALPASARWTTCWATWGTRRVPSTSAPSPTSTSR